ncbi:MAG TPA: VOC family protein [Verrucomicrobiae bacterium]|nr:VOC family protein [Verrucomicrobiae bacterium]
MDKQTPGSIGWVDLTVPDAVAIRDFYAYVTGWTPFGVAMGGYEDYCMNAEGGHVVSGICHARGENAEMPPVWMIYIVVSDLEDAVKRCLDRGGKVRIPPKNMGSGRYSVIEDPAGAVAALYETPPSAA